jgi:glycosyltransferase involved in cell wall biosynthesis
MRLGFLTSWALDDPDSWSGVIRPMYAALHAALGTHSDLVPIPVAVTRHHLLDRMATRLLGQLGRGYLPEHSLATSRSWAAGTTRAVLDADVDVVLSVAASTPLAYARHGLPVVEVSDSTFGAVTGYYPQFSGLHAVARWQGEVLGRRTSRRAAAFLIASDWAARSLVEDYGVDRARVTVAPFGPSTTSAVPPGGPRPGEPLRLLFVGRDWVRKGGEQAVAIAAGLRRAGIPCELTVVGAGPSAPGTLSDDVRVLGRVARSGMAELYAAHDVLLEPARANAGGVTLTDATASGLPVVATRTGGVPTIVEDGVTGFLLDADDPVPEAVAALRRLAEPDVWRAMSAAGVRRGTDVLSWERWAATTIEVCARVARSRI